jgi:hypothetical protein
MDFFIKNCNCLIGLFTFRTVISKLCIITWRSMNCNSSLVLQFHVSDSVSISHYPRILSYYIIGLLTKDCSYWLIGGLFFHCGDFYLPC